MPEPWIEIGPDPATTRKQRTSTAPRHAARYRWKSTQLIMVYGLPIVALRYEYQMDKRRDRKQSFWRRGVKSLAAWLRRFAFDRG